MTDWTIDPATLAELGTCKHCNGHGARTALQMREALSAPGLEKELEAWTSSVGVAWDLSTTVCDRCAGCGHVMPWPWPGAEVFSREYELPGEGWRRLKTETAYDKIRQAWARFDPNEGQRKANVYGWRVRDLDREGKVVRVYEPVFRTFR